MKLLKKLPLLLLFAIIYLIAWKIAPNHLEYSEDKDPYNY